MNMADNSLKKGRYTKYSNKIGLHSNSKGGFIKNDTDVVLSFPFKDTILEAGMSKEDVGREERFLHIEVDSKDIDTLEEPKVLTNFKLVDKNGEKQDTLVGTNYSVYKSEYDPDNDLLYAFARLDLDNNGQIDDTEPIHIFGINLKNPSKHFQLYKP